MHRPMRKSERDGSCCSSERKRLGPRTKQPASNNVDCASSNTIQQLAAFTMMMMHQQPTSPAKSSNGGGGGGSSGDEQVKKMRMDKTKMFLDFNRLELAKQQQQGPRMSRSRRASMGAVPSGGGAGYGDYYVKPSSQPTQIDYGYAGVLEQQQRQQQRQDEYFQYPELPLPGRSRRASMGASPADIYGNYGGPDPRMGLQQPVGGVTEEDGYGTDSEAAKPSKRAKARRASLSLRNDASIRRSRRASMGGAPQNGMDDVDGDGGSMAYGYDQYEYEQAAPANSSRSRRASMSGAMPKYDYPQGKVSRRMSNRGGASRRMSNHGGASRRRSATGSGPVPSAAPVVNRDRGINPDALARMTRRMSGNAGHQSIHSDYDDDDDDEDYGGAAAAAYGYGYGGGVGGCGGLGGNPDTAYGYGYGCPGVGTPSRSQSERRLERRGSNRSHASASSARSSRSRRRNSCLIRKEADQQKLAEILGDEPPRVSDSDVAESSGEEFGGIGYDSAFDSDSSNDNVGSMINHVGKRRNSFKVHTAGGDPITAIIKGKDNNLLVVQNDDDDDDDDEEGDGGLLTLKTGVPKPPVLKTSTNVRTTKEKDPWERSTPFTTSHQDLTRDKLLLSEQRHATSPSNEMIPGFSIRNNWGEMGLESLSSSSDGSNASFGASLYTDSAHIQEIDRYKQRARRRSSLEKSWLHIGKLLEESEDSNTKKKNKSKDRVATSGMATKVPKFTPATNCSNASDYVVRCFCARLRSGITVIKHNRSRWSKSQLRILYLLPDGRTLSWKPMEGDEDKGKRPKLDLMKCTEVRHSWTKDPETRKQLGTSVLRKRCTDKNINKSFALIFKKRTLDVTALSSDQCRLMMEGFSALCFRLQYDKLQQEDDGNESDSCRRSVASRSFRTDDDWASTVYGGESTVSMTQTAASAVAIPTSSPWGL